jgi:MFS transporter, putative metabolite:H+ symporter
MEKMPMAGQSSDDLLAMFDSAPLNRRYWTSFALLSAITILDFFDFFLIAFILSKIGPEWKLTYGQSGLILYGGGIGAILGALIWGSLSDVLGRKLQIVSGTFICAVSSALIGVLPTGAWIALTALRVLVGFGLAAAVTPCLTAVVELTPTRWRTMMTSFYVVFASAGTFVASLVSATLFEVLGWRGLAMLGIAPAIFGFLVWFFVPESVRWLAAKGRFAEARDAVANHLGRRCNRCRCRPSRRPRRRAAASRSFTPTRACSGRPLSCGAVPRPRPTAITCGGRQ